MIKITIKTIKAGSGYTNPAWDIIRTDPVVKALYSLVFYELGFGGEVIEFTDTKLVVRTHVLANIDTHTFEGSKKDMEPLLLACLYHDQTKKTPEALAKQFHPQFQGLPNAYFAWSAGLLAGGAMCGHGRLKAVMLLALGIQDEKIIEYCIGLKEEFRKQYPDVAHTKTQEWEWEHFLAVLDLLRDGASFEQVLELSA